MSARANPWATGSPPAGVTDQTQPDLTGQAQYVWDPGTLQWVKMVQPGGGGGGAVTQGTVPWITSEQLATYTPLSGDVSAGGDNTVITPGAGKTVRLYYLALSAALSNSTSVVCRVRAASVGTPWYTVELVPGAIYARNVGAGKFYVAGAVNDALIINLSGALVVHWSFETDQV